MLTLADALEALTNFRPIATTVITEAVIDSRQVIPGSLFVAIPGEKVDGHDFIAEAFRRGASFALIQRDAVADGIFPDPRPARRFIDRFVFPRGSRSAAVPACGKYSHCPATDRALLAPQTGFAGGRHYRQCGQIHHQGNGL